MVVRWPSWVSGFAIQESLYMSSKRTRRSTKRIVQVDGNKRTEEMSSNEEILENRDELIKPLIIRVIIEIVPQILKLIISS